MREGPGDRRPGCGAAEEAWMGGLPVGVRPSPGVPVVTRPGMQTEGSLHGSPNVPCVCIHRLIKARRRVQAGPETLLLSPGPKGRGHFWHLEPAAPSGLSPGAAPAPPRQLLGAGRRCPSPAAAHSPAAVGPPRPCNSSSGPGPSALPPTPTAPIPPPMHSSPPGSREDFRGPVFWKHRGSSWKWCKTVPRHRGSEG